MLTTSPTMPSILVVSFLFCHRASVVNSVAEVHQNSLPFYCAAFDLAHCHHRHSKRSQPHWKHPCCRALPNPLHERRRPSCEMLELCTALPVLGLRGGRQADPYLIPGAVAQKMERTQKRHYKVRAAERAQEVSLAPSPGSSHMKRAEVKGKVKDYAVLESPSALREQHQQQNRAGGAIGDESGEVVDGEEETLWRGDNGKSRRKSVGWEAVGAGVTNARDLLGLPKKREWTNGGKAPAKKSRIKQDSEDPRASTSASDASANNESIDDCQADAATGEISRGTSKAEAGAGMPREGRGGRGAGVEELVEGPDPRAPISCADGGSSEGSRESEETTSFGNSDADNQERLDVDWDPAQEDPDLPDYLAGRRRLTSALLQRLIKEAGVDSELEIKPEHDPNQDPTARFCNSPKVFLVGRTEAAVKLHKRLPRGFAVVPLNGTLSVLARAPSPPPQQLLAGTGEQDEDEAEVSQEPLPESSDGSEDGDETGLVYDAQYLAANLTHKEYCRAMEPRILKLRRRAERHDGNSAFEVGMRLVHGMGVRKDPINGCRFLMNAAAQGHCYAQAEVGTCYYWGVGVKQHVRKAVEWWKLASAGNEHVPQGVAAAMHNLGVAYGEGCGELKKDYLLACHWLKKAAKQGDAHAQFNLAHYYSVGKGVRRHERKAAYWLLQSARQGDAEAALHMAARYWSRGSDEARGEAPRERVCLEEPRHLARESPGTLTALTLTALLPAGAQGVQRSLEKAALWLRKAALTLEQPRLILAALEHGANATVVDALFPPQLEKRGGTDAELEEAHAALQQEIRAQLQSARTRAAAVHHMRAQDDLVGGARIGRRLEAALGEASLAALHSLNSVSQPTQLSPAGDASTAAATRRGASTVDVDAASAVDDTMHLRAPLPSRTPSPE